ncbi:MAG: heme biosynthesis HemY N-terminal domain-containing protein [Betaproteobacteria bacterium]|nr:heme biosynthesis HemY N-terminal domain-containing protein [Betaproteobacteria bacterium]
MRGLMWVLAVFALAVGLSLAAHLNDGYAILVFPPYRAELSLNLAILLGLAGFVLGYLLLRMVTHTIRLPLYVRDFRRRRRDAKGRAALLVALQAMFEGRYARAEKAAGKAYKLGQAPALSALIAARAAAELRELERRDQWLARADSQDSDARQARLAVQASLLLDDRRYDDALAVLRELSASEPKRISTQRMLMKAHQRLGHWDEVRRLATALAKRGALAEAAAAQLRITAQIEALRQQAGDATGLAACWQRTDDRLDARVARSAAQLFIDGGECRRAHEIVAAALEAEWSEDLILLYGECLGADVLGQIERAEKWLKSRPRDRALLLTLGRLCLQQELWGKAQSYLEASLSEEPSRSAHVALARLFERIGKPEDANRHYRASADAKLRP